jgi:ParB family transcriptional regulator, chromosome partitioning protein
MTKALNKMLEEKLQKNLKQHALASQDVNFSGSREFSLVPVEKIEANPYQPRRIFPQAELEKLAASIAEVGLLEPVLLRKVRDSYQIAAGERRWRAHKLLGKHTIESIVTDITDSDMAVFALAENMDREDLSDYEIGLAIRQIENIFPTKKKLAESLGLNREDMYRYFAFEDLPEFIRTDLNNDPRLLSRSAASDIKRLLNQNKDSQTINAYLAEAWALLLANELDQTKITGFIARKLKTSTENREGFDIQDQHYLIQNHKKVGTIARAGKHLTVKINTDVVNKEKEQKLRAFVQALINEEDKKV